MKNIAIAIAILAAAPLAASADVSKEDIKKLAAAGVGEEVILTFIRSNGPVTRLSADDVIELKAAGASEKVLWALVGEPAAAPRIQVEKQVVERPVYVPSTTYVYETPSYATSYYPYSYPYYWPSYYSSCYPQYSYSSYYPRYSYSTCGPRYGVSYYGGGGCYPRSSWSLSIRR